MSQKHLYTVEEFEQMSEFDEYYELIKGKISENPKPTYGDARVSIICDNVLDAIREIDPERKLGRGLRSVSVKLSSIDAPLPNVSYWKKSTLSKLSKHSGPCPELAVEILIPEEDLEALREKAIYYLNAGVSLVWIIDAEGAFAEIFYRGQKEQIIIPPNGELDASAILPGFKIKLVDLFRWGNFSILSENLTGED